MNTYSHTSITATNNGYLLGYSSSGKEKDSETGLSYFGARYYEPEMLNIWLSVDPMADKYPNMCPYNYCAWNPIKLVDLDGCDTINVKYKDGKWRFDGDIKIAKGNDVFNITGPGVDNYTQYVFDQGDYGNRMNVVLLEDDNNVGESFGVYHLSGTRQCGYLLEPSSKNNANHYHAEGDGYSTYIGMGTAWKSYVGLRGHNATGGIRIHYGQGRSWSTGCSIISTDYVPNREGKVKSFNLEESRSAVKTFCTYAGAVSVSPNQPMPTPGSPHRKRDLYNWDNKGINQFRKPTINIRKGY